MDERIHKVDVFYDVEHRWFSAYLTVMVCDCHDLVWADEDIHSDGRSLLCPLVPQEAQ